jgi:hypothetical protein
MSVYTPPMDAICPNPLARIPSRDLTRCAIIRRRRHDVRVHALYDHPSARHGERAVRIFTSPYIAPRKPRGTRVTRRCPASPPMTLAIGIMTHGSCASHPSSSRAHRIARRADSRTHALTITHGFPRTEPRRPCVATPSSCAPKARYVRPIARPAGSIESWGVTTNHDQGTSTLVDLLQ